MRHGAAILAACLVLLPCAADARGGGRGGFSTSHSRQWTRARHEYLIATHRTAERGSGRRGRFEGPGIYEINGQEVKIYGIP